VVFVIGLEDAPTPFLAGRVRLALPERELELAEAAVQELAHEAPTRVRVKAPTQPGAHVVAPCEAYGDSSHRPSFGESGPPPLGVAVGPVWHER
jgi:hypothetical protein